MASYTVIFELSQDRRMNIGKLGAIFFKKGYYIYVGKAPIKWVKKRIERHKRKDKILRWHIDYFSVNPSAKFLGSKLFLIKECDLAKNLSRKFSSIDKFGSSDCGCTTHLFHCKNKKILDNSSFGPFLTKYI